MDGGQHEGACDDERHAAAVFIVDKAEERCHQDSAERGNRREETCEVGIDTVFHHHQARGELQERRYGGIEQHAEERDEPESG